jgi:hypothetical protein
MADLLGRHHLPVVDLGTMTREYDSHEDFLKLFAWGYTVLQDTTFHLFLPSRRGFHGAPNSAVFAAGSYATYVEAVDARDSVVVDVSFRSFFPTLEFGSDYGIKIFHTHLQKKYAHKRLCTCCFCDAALLLCAQFGFIPTENFAQINRYK